MLDFVSNLFANPVVTHLLVLVAGWLGVKQPTMIANLWGKILGIANTVDKAQELIKTLDTMLKVNNVIPAEAPTPPAAMVADVAAGKMTVTDAKAKLKALAKK